MILSLFLGRCFILFYFVLSLILLGSTTIFVFSIYILNKHPWNKINSNLFMYFHRCEMKLFIFFLTYILFLLNGWEEFFCIHIRYEYYSLIYDIVVYTSACCVLQIKLYVDREYMRNEVKHYKNGSRNRFSFYFHGFGKHSSFAYDMT